MQQTQLPSEVKISFYKKLSRKKWFKIARPFIIAILIILTIYILTVVGVFKISKIEIINDLKYATNLEQITNQYKGKGYFFLDLEQMEEEIQNSNKYVKSVEAEKIFPNKILLDIQEYIPMFYTEYKDTCYIISEEGIILEQNKEYEKCEIEEGIKLESKQNIIADDKLIFDTEIWEIAKILKEFGWNIQNIKFNQNDVEISDGERKVTIEINEEYQNQLSKLYLVLEKVNIEGIEYKSLDLRFERPVMELL